MLISFLIWPEKKNAVTQLSEYADLDNFEDWSKNGEYITRIVAGQPREHSTGINMTEFI